MAKILSSRAAKNQMEKFKKQQMYGLDLDGNKTTPEVPSKFTFNLQKSISTRELVNPQLDRVDKADLISALKKDKDLQDAQIDFEKVPKYLLYDTYSWFNNPMNTIKLGKVDEQNKWQYNMIRKMNNIYLRTATENSLPHSYMVTSEYTKMFYAKIEEEQKKDPNKSAEDILKEWTEEDENKKPGQKSSLDKAMAEANKRMDEKMKDYEEKGGMLADKGEEIQTFGETTSVLEALRYMKHIKISNKTIQDFVKTSLKLSTSHFSASYQETEESIFDSDEIEDLSGIEYLMPEFRHAHLEDITTSLRRYNLNFDIYIDNSGSMESSIRMESGGSISAFDLCKITALKIVQLGYGKDIYLFNNQVYKMEIKKLVQQQTHGGTSTHKVIDQIIKLGRPGLILTDMCDSIYTYTKNAYFIGINGANFEGLQRDAKRYLSDKQVMIYENGLFKKASTQN